MMSSSNGNILRVTGPLWGESTGHRWSPLIKASDAELWCFLWSAPEQTVAQTIETPVIWDAIAFIMMSLKWVLCMHAFTSDTARLSIVRYGSDTTDNKEAMGLSISLSLDIVYSWWHHQMETFSALLALWAGNLAVTGDFFSQMPVTRSFKFFFISWANNQDAGDLRRHCAHYGAIVMFVDDIMIQMLGKRKHGDGWWLGAYFGSRASATRIWYADLNVIWISTTRGRVAHICVNKLGHHWVREEVFRLYGVKPLSKKMLFYC